MSLQATSRLDNYGKIKSYLGGSLHGGAFVNAGTVVLGGISRINFRDIHNLLEAGLSSKEGLALTYDTLTTHGIIGARNFVHLSGRKSENAGDIDSERILVTGPTLFAADLQDGENPHQESFINHKSLVGTQEVKVWVDRLFNNGEMRSVGKLSLVGNDLENSGII